MHSSSRLRVAIAIVVSVVGTACSGDADEDESEPPAATPSSTASLPRPVVDRTTADLLTVDPEPVWSSPAAQNPQIAVVDGVAVVTGLLPPRSAEDTVLAADLRTGAERWRVEHGAVVPGTDSVRLGGLFAYGARSVVTTTTDTGAAVVLPFQDDGCEFGCDDRADARPLGVLALDARTGEVVWGNALIESEDSYPGRLSVGLETVSVTAAGSEVVVAEIGSRLVVDRPFDDEDERTLPVAAVGLDPATGRRLWVRNGTHPLDVVGDIVLAIEHRARTRLLGLDARTGAVRWRGTEVLDHDQAVGAVLLDSVSPRLVAVGPGIATPRLLDPATGRDLPDQLPDGAKDCGRWRGGALHLACVWYDPATAESRLLTVDAAGRQALSAATIAAAPEVTTAGLVGLVDLLTDRGTVIDAAGRGAGRIGPGQLVTVSGPWVVVHRGEEGRGRLVVLRRR